MTKNKLTNGNERRRNCHKHFFISLLKKKSFLHTTLFSLLNGLSAIWNNFLSDDMLWQCQTFFFFFLNARSYALRDFSDSSSIMVHLKLLNFSGHNCVCVCVWLGMSIISSQFQNTKKTSSSGRTGKIEQLKQFAIISPSWTASIIETITHEARKKRERNKEIENWKIDLTSCHWDALIVIQFQLNKTKNNSLISHFQLSHSPQLQEWCSIASQQISAKKKWANENDCQVQRALLMKTVCLIYTQLTAAVHLQHLH